RSGRKKAAPAPQGPHPPGQRPAPAHATAVRVQTAPHHTAPPATAPENRPARTPTAGKTPTKVGPNRDGARTVNRWRGKPPRLAPVDGRTVTAPRPRDQNRCARDVGGGAGRGGSGMGRRRPGYAGRSDVHAALDAARRDTGGQGRLILVRGPHGIGRSTLLRAVGESWRRDGVRVIEATLVGAVDAAAFDALVQAVREQFEHIGDPRPLAATGRLAAAVTARCDAAGREAA